jgi:uncharacterized membrane protein YfcA
MIYPYSVTLFILCPLIFLAGFIDSIAGGGGLISLPAYIFVGLPIHSAYGTNKLPNSMGTATAMVNYFRSKSIDFSAAVPGGIGALLGSWIGTRLALSLSPRVLQICLMVILPLVGVFIFTRRGVENAAPKEPLPSKLKYFLSFAIGLACGCYDGFFGPGAGMFMTLALVGLVRLELIKAVGTTKVINFASNFASVITWFVNGKIIFPIAIPCIACSMAGGFLGSRLAVKIGTKLIRLVLALVAAMLFIKILFDLIGTLR